MNTAGAWRRDIHDRYVIQEVLNYHRREIEGKEEEYPLPDWWTVGRIDSQKEVGGLPELESKIIPEWIDSNRDGLPDWWTAARGLDSDDPDLPRKDSNGNGYTNLEDYINDLEAIRITHQLAGFESPSD
ncbi:MAG: hypothetical protein WD490_00110 [Opitutales bacterium]